MRTIKDMDPEDKGIVIKIHGSGPLKKRILDMGLTKGTEVTVIKKAPLGDPIEVKIRDYDLSLRRGEAEIIEIE